MNDKILVPLDGSIQADKALDWALDLAEKYRSSIELLTIIPLTETFMTGTYSKPGKVPLLGPSVTELKERAKKLLDDTLQRVKKPILICKYQQGF